MDEDEYGADEFDVDDNNDKISATKTVEKPKIASLAPSIDPVLKNRCIAYVTT